MKTALITGANKGIGHEVARQLAAKRLNFAETTADKSAFLGHVGCAVLSAGSWTRVER
jgi:NAD(P)-dependent dehydrogenase (short-subunit alcohol dehydrogenase family)